MGETEISSFNWRNVGVKRERNHEALISRLYGSNRSIFQYLKDIMVFAAMVGHSLQEKREISGESVEIILDTYASDQKDGFIYLLGLLDEKDGKILKDEHLRSAVKVFEEYCNAGLYTIEQWLDDNPGDPDGVDTLLEKIYERLAENEKEHGVANEDIDLDV
ncbi:MAG: DNA phosphorothioation-associated protein 4 [Marinobacter sp.]|jgi:dnd system-associated protein 4|nr:DNA phosphorothioation-associated protein 4 [Marinobacter sp.]PTB91712.1 DNA phosphorothioation-associated protein 4 [Marinobacter sp. Z-F4-2]|tara:strand:+ start:2396 stop:2881 length:486 start_codon:yes stop_codon:yes gene_type:complete